MTALPRSGGDDDDDDAPSDMPLVWVVCGVGAVVLIGGLYLTKSGGEAGGASKTGSEQTSAKGGLELA